MTLDELRTVMPYAGARAATFLEPLNRTMKEFEINTTARKAAFLAQIAHESGSLRYLKEIASGDAYEGRKDLGNTENGDGKRFKGRGLLQITGRENYRKCSEALFANDYILLDKPELLELPENACRSAGWFWESRGLNELADKGEFTTITRRINGGTNGLQDRLAHWDRALQVLA